MARAELAASGCRSTLVSEVEEWATKFMGLSPDMEAAWREGNAEVLNA
jgi:hypothetical protein